MRSKGVDVGLKSTSIQKWCTDGRDNNLPCGHVFDNHDLLPSGYSGSFSADVGSVMTNIIGCLD